MADVFTKDKRSDVMSRIRSKDTKPELQVRHALHALGLRYKLHDKSLPGKPDLVFPKYKSVVQVRGCFWHGHNCHVDHKPKSNKAYWGPKISNNKMRDKKNDQALRDLGWNVIVIWECSCRDKAYFKNVIEECFREIKNN